MKKKKKFTAWIWDLTLNPTQEPNDADVFKSVMMQCRGIHPVAFTTVHRFDIFIFAPLLHFSYPRLCVKIQVSFLQSCRNIAVKLSQETTSLLSKSAPVNPSTLFFFFLRNHCFFFSIWDPVTAATALISGTKFNIYIVKINQKPGINNKIINTRRRASLKFSGTVWWFLLCATVPWIFIECIQAMSWW